MTILRFANVPDQYTYYWLAVIYFLNAMGAYQVFSIPLQWLGSILAILSFIILLYKGRTCHEFYLYPLLLILFMFFFSTLGWWFWSVYIDFENLLPAGATTDYYLFILLRYLQYLVFFAVYFLSINYLKKNGLLRLANTVVICGIVVSIYAVYVYIAQIYGLPEIPRSRVGTGGEEQSVIFTYAFHRAMGSFREPSHLAQWLVLPFFMTFIDKSYWYLGARFVIVFVVLLTGSLTGIIAIFAGYLFAMLLTFPLHRALFRVVKFGIVLLLAGFLFSLFALPNEGGSVDILVVVIDRLIPILQDGLGASNRGHIYEYVTQHSIPLIGYGFGNANLLIGDYMGLGLVGSFLSLYLNMLYSLGYVGFLFVIIVLAAPVFLLLRFRAVDKDQFFVLFGAYVGWLLVYLALTEEFSISFAILYGACVHYYRCQLEAVSPTKPTISAAV
jgi:hypothetical protein